MRDPKHTPVFLICGQQLRDVGEPFRGFNGTECDCDPKVHFLYHQHIYGPTPANDPYCPRPTY